MTQAAKRLSGEDRLIARYFKPLAKHPGAFGLVDDAAAITPPTGCDLVLKTDGIIGGVHFFPDDPPEAVARKALRVNLSDLAAKGARPLGFLLTLALPKAIGDAWLGAFARGLGADADRFGCPLFGGDTVRTPGPITISIAVFGAVPHGKMVRRAGARAGRPRDGDRHDRRRGARAAAAARRPRRRDDGGSIARAAAIIWRAAIWCRSRATRSRRRLRAHASAAMDVSDGLVGDLDEALPRLGRHGRDRRRRACRLSPAARAALAKEPALIETILTGGDDYEVLATMPARRSGGRSGRRRAAAGVAVTEIGHDRGGQGARPVSSIRTASRSRFAHPSFSHF